MLPTANTLPAILPVMPYMLGWPLLSIAAVVFLPQVAQLAASSAPQTATKTIKSTDPLIFYEGRWDDSPGMWW